MQISDYRGNCSLIVMKHLTGKPDKEIVSTAISYGFSTKGRGMSSAKISEAIKELGIRLERINTKKENANQNQRLFHKASRYKTLSTLAIEYPDDVLVCHVDGHVLLLSYGDILDDNYSHTQPSRHVITAHKATNHVLSAPSEKKPYSDDITFRLISWNRLIDRFRNFELRSKVYNIGEVLRENKKTVRELKAMGFEESILKRLYRDNRVAIE